MIRRNLIGTVLLVCLLAFLSACGSRQRVVLPADFKGPKELSRLYGVRLTPNDNIYLYNVNIFLLNLNIYIEIVCLY